MLHENWLTIRYLHLTMDKALRESLAAQVGHSIKAGDAILLNLPTGETMLIDSGMPHSGPMLQTRLHDLGITRLDHVLVTHPHWDHLGGLLTVLPQVSVGQFYQSPVIHGASEHYQELQRILEEQEIPIKELLEGDLLRFGALTLEFINPPSEQVPKSGEMITTAEMNNLSLVMRLDYEHFSMLFTGDIYCEQEDVLVSNYGLEKLHVAILDVPHHGKETSSSQRFIKTVNPQVAIISHEESNQLREERYKDLGIPTLSTADYGELVLATDGKTVIITAQTLTTPLILDL